MRPFEGEPSTGTLAHALFVVSDLTGEKSNHMEHYSEVENISGSRNAEIKF